MNENWNPVCRHDYSGISETVFMSASNYSVSLKFLLKGFQSYKTVFNKLNNNMHETPTVKELTGIGNITVNYDIKNDVTYEMRIYSKDCDLGIDKCTHYLKFNVYSLNGKDDVCYLQSVSKE